MIPHNIKYRPEIDGIRAIAVLAVIFFHAGFSTFSGGYIGVDIFFVISGYLITSIISKDLEHSRFSLVTFYERRARRILPALFLVVLLTIAAAYFCLLPPQMLEFSKSIGAVALFVSNVLFWRTSGYFDSTAGEKPLLHTWSLGVEEQFYIFFPLILFFLWKHRKNFLVPGIVLIAFGSLAVSQWLSQGHAMANFFLIPSRAWELMIGALAALIFKHKEDLSSGAKNALSALGFLMMVLPIFMFTDATPTPSVLALPPTLGTALLLAFSQKTAVGRLLSLKALVAVGLLSYSAYLWHQPIFAMVRARSLQEPTHLESTLLIALTVLLSYLSWRFVEAPFRNTGKFSRNTVFAYASVGTIMLLGFSFLGTRDNGLQFRVDSHTNAILDARDILSDPCHSQFSTSDIQNNKYCRLGLKDRDPTLVILGDSLAGSMLMAVDDWATKQHIAVAAVTDGWCAPLLDFGSQSANPKCRSLQNASLEKFASSASVNTVVLMAEWANYTEGQRWNSHLVAYTDGESKSATPQENPAVFSRALARTVEFLHQHGKRIVIVKSVPEFEFEIKTALAKIAFFKLDSKTLHPTTGADYKERNRNVLEIFARLPGPVTFLDPYPLFCESAVKPCAIHNSEGIPYFSDGAHLTKDGAKFALQIFPSNISSPPNVAATGFRPGE